MYSSYGRLIGIRKELVIRRLLSTHEATQLLGVDANATKKELKKAYLTKAKQYHPDNGDTGNETMFRKVHQAHDVLVNQLDQPKTGPKSDKSNDKRGGGYQTYDQYQHMTMAQRQVHRAREHARKEQFRQRQYHVDHQRYYAQRKLQFAILHFIYIFMTTCILGYLFLSTLDDQGALFSRQDQEDKFVLELLHIRQSFRTVAKVKKISVMAVYVEYAHYVDGTLLNRRSKLSSEDLIFLDRTFLGGDPRTRRFVLTHPDYILNERLPNSYKSLRN